MDNHEESSNDSTIFQSCYDLSQQFTLEKKQAEAEYNQSKFQESVKKKTSLEQKLQGSEQKNKELEFKNQDLEQNYKVLESKYIQLKQQQEELEQQFKDQNKKFNEQEQKFNEQKIDYIQQQETHSKCVNKLQNLEDNYKQQEYNIKEQEQKYNTLKKQYDILKQEHYELRQTYNILEQKGNQNVQNKTDLLQKVNESEKNCDQLKKKYNEQEEILKELEKEIQKYQEQEQNHQLLQQKYEKQVQNQKQVELKFTESQQKLKELEQKYYELEQKHIKNCEDKNYNFRQIEQLKQELLQKNKLIDKLSSSQKQEISQEKKQIILNQETNYNSNIYKSQVFEITEDDELEPIEHVQTQAYSQQYLLKEIIFQKLCNLPSQLKQSKDFLLQLIQQVLIPSNKGKSIVDDDIIILDKIENQLPISILIGQDDIGKLKIMNLLFQNKKTKLFTLYKQEELKRNIVNTDAFEFEDIEEREQQIIKYQQLFQKYPNKVENIFIVVKFERTDIMKKNILEIYKYFQKFQEVISLIIFDFHYSENQEKDKVELEQKLQCFQFHKIFYLQNNTTKYQLIEELQKSLKNELVEFDLNSTIFEPVNFENQQEIVSQFLKY